MLGISANIGDAYARRGQHAARDALTPFTRATRTEVPDAMSAAQRLAEVCPRVRRVTSDESGILLRARCLKYFRLQEPRTSPLPPGRSAKQRQGTSDGRGNTLPQCARRLYHHIGLGNSVPYKQPVLPSCAGECRGLSSRSTSTSNAFRIPRTPRVNITEPFRAARMIRTEKVDSSTRSSKTVSPLEVRQPTVLMPLSLGIRR